MPQLIVEECTRNGVHVAYHRVTELPVRIGRAFDNEIVLNDPYVSPQHLVLEAGDDGWIAIDQNSDNGTFIGRNNKFTGAKAIVSGDQLTVGRTLLRIWSPAHAVAPSLRLPAQTDSHQRMVIPVYAVISILFTAAALTFSRFLETAKQASPLSLFANAIPLLSFTFVWAGIWACAGFIVRRKGHYGLQLMVANGALVFVLLLTALTEYIDYFTNGAISTDIVQYSGMAILSTLLLFSNLAISTGIANLRRAAIALFIGSGIVATVAITDRAESFEKKITPEYSRTLKPPYAKIARSTTLEKFIKESEALFDVVQRTNGKTGR
jgi:hypothetical protein